MIDDYLRDDSMQEFEIFCCELRRAGREGRRGAETETEQRKKLIKKRS